MADVVQLRKGGTVRKAAAATIAPGEVQQVPDGRAGWLSRTTAIETGLSATLTAEPNTVSMTKATGFVALAGGRAYWDFSANNVTYRKVNDRDYYLGRFAADAESAATTCDVTLNIDPAYDIDLCRDAFNTVLVGTPAVGGFGYPVRLGGAHVLELDATNEAQKVDLISVDGFAVAANAIIEGAFRVLSDGSGADVDVSIGSASGTHASDFQAVAEFVALHLDANDVDINVQSDDTATDVGPTDSGVNYTEGSSVAERVEFWIDTRNPADVQVYINGSLVLGSTVFTLAAATGPLFLIVHVEKTASTDTYKLAVDWLRARFQE